MGFDGFTSAWLDQQMDDAASLDALADCTHAVGIDPGATTGIVLWDCAAKRITETMNGTFHSAADLLRRFDKGTLYVVLETPKENSFMYGRHVQSLKKALRSRSYKRAWGQARSAMRIAMKVGENQKEGELLREIAEERHPLKTVRPTGQKWDAEACASVLGYPPANENPHYNNEHIRDALRLLHNAGIIPRGGCAYLQDA